MFFCGFLLLVVVVLFLTCLGGKPKADNLLKNKEFFKKIKFELRRKQGEVRRKQGGEVRQKQGEVRLEIVCRTMYANVTLNFMSEEK